MRLNVFNPYTYTLETIIQAGLSNMRVMSVAVRTNEDLRPSRLVKSISSYVRRSLVTIFRVFVTSRTLFFFFCLATLLSLPGLLTGVRFLFFYFRGACAGPIQSLFLILLTLLL